MYSHRMNLVKLKIHKEVLKEVRVHFDGAEDFINSKIKEICSQEKLSINGVRVCCLLFWH